jgi:hypothetical protein
VVKHILYLVLAACVMSTAAYAQCDPGSYVLIGSSASTRNEFPSTGGTTSVTLFVPSGCSWTITNIPSWVTILNGTSGTDTRVVQISVAANTSSAPRSQFIVIGGRNFPIYQTGVPLTFTPMQPCRIADTRGIGNLGPGFGGPFLTAGVERSFNVLASVCPVPANAKAYSLNITVVPRSGSLIYLLAWPTGGQRPNASTLNSLDGRIVANAAIVAAGTNGAISTYASDNTEVIIDINGYFTEPPVTGLSFYRVTPCRVMDTRAGQGFTGSYGPPALAANSTRTISLTQSNCALPPSAQAYSVNVTVVPSGSLNYLVAFPAGQPQPPSSTLNSLNGSIVANAAIVPSGGGSISLFATNQTDVIVDINGYFAPAGSPNALVYHPLTPCRIADTRGFDGFTGPFGPPALPPNTFRTIPMRSSQCRVPTLAQVYTLNSTAVPSGSVLTFLTVQPTTGSFLGVSTLNASTGQVTANMAIVPAGTNGAVDLYGSHFTDVILDLNGYFSLQ